MKQLKVTKLCYISVPRYRAVQTLLCCNNLVYVTGPLQLDVGFHLLKALGNQRLHNETVGCFGCVCVFKDSFQIARHTG